MFRNAYKIAREFTLPVIMSRRDFAGKCSSSLGAFVVINSDGWIVTAGHIIEQWIALAESAKLAQDRKTTADALRADAAMPAKEKQEKLRSLGKPSATDTEFASALWGVFPIPVNLTQMVHVKGVDIGIGKLEPFDPAWINSYPTFKNPNLDFDHGTALCKLGFPFHSFEPSYDAVNNSFMLPSSALPVPLFPIDGIYTRQVNQAPPAGDTFPFPFIWVETSTPGLKGQSGGPTFDSHGTIWAIQCQTASYPLGFDTKGPEQFLHVGLGVHPTTIFALLDMHGVQYQVSNY